MVKTTNQCLLHAPSAFVSVKHPLVFARLGHSSVTQEGLEAGPRPRAVGGPEGVPGGGPAGGCDPMADLIGGLEHV